MRWRILFLVFAMWSVISCGGGGGAPRFTLNVSVSGQGSVTSNPVGITCPGDCSESYAQNTQVTLTANPAQGWQFSSWAGCDSVNGNQCTVTMNANKNVTANFTQITHPVSVSIQPSGAGKVTSNPPGIDCPDNACQANFAQGSTVTLTAQANQGYRFDSWQGCDSVNGTQCTLNITGAKNVTATFVQVFTLTVNKQGTGTGTVTSTPQGIDCGQTCSASFDVGSQVTLTANPDPTSRFDGWGGDCSGTDLQTTVTMDVDKTCTATFTLESLIVSGQVNWDTGSPAGDADILVRTEDGSVQKSTQTGTDGRYAVGISPQTAQVVIVRAQKDVPPIVASFKRSAEPLSSGQLTMPDVILPNPSGAQLTCGGGTCQNPDNSVQFHNLPGNVANMWARSYDPENNPEAFPGEFGEQNGPILSNLFIWVAAQDSQGNAIGPIDPPATARIKIAPVQWPYLFDQQPNQNNGIQIPIYFFNEQQGAWESQGNNGVLTDSGGNVIDESQQDAILNGTYQGDIYAQFPVNHLSWWNVDYPPPACQWEFGDAPDGPYRSLLASNGPRHRDLNPPRFWLGRWVDCETDSEQVNRDRYDDGVLQRDPLKIRVSNWNWPGTFYLNVFIDQNNDGDWDDPGEWVVQNYPVNIPQRKSASSDELPGFPQNITWPQNTWLRAMVTERQLSTPSDFGEFDFGETEDLIELTHIMHVFVSGSGRVVSTPPGIDCRAGEVPDCQEEFPEGRTVRLDAVPDQGRSFLGWSQDCASAGNNPTCELVMDTDKWAGALFQVGLTVRIEGRGTVNVNPPNDDCTADEQPCTYGYNPSEAPTVVLTPTPEQGWEFSGWFGCDSVQGSQCVVFMWREVEVTARFLTLGIVTPSPLPDAFVGQAYTAYIDATGGLKPYTWSKVSGTGDGWLTFTQEGDRYKLSGTPTATGQANFRVRVVDSSSPQRSDEKDFLINILQAGAQDLIMRFRDRCGNPLPGVWAYLTEPRTEEQFSSSGGTVQFSNVPVPYTVTWGYDDGDANTQDRLDTARITDNSLRDVTMTIDDVPRTPCPGEGSGTASVSGSVSGQSGDSGGVGATLPVAPTSDTVFALPLDPAYSLQFTSLPDDGTAVPLALGAMAVDPVFTEGSRCVRVGLLRNMSIRKGDNLTGQNISLDYNCTRDENGNYTFPPSFTQFHQAGVSSGLNPSPEGGQLPVFGWNAGGQNPQNVPGNFSIRLPSGAPYQTGDRYQHIFQFVFVEQFRGDGGGSDLTRGVWVMYNKPAADPVGDVRFLPLANPVNPQNEATGVPLTVPFQWNLEDPNDPEIVMVELTIRCVLAGPSGGCPEPGAEVWGIHLQGTPTQFTLPDLSQASQKPAGLGMSPSTLYEWKVVTTYLDLNLIVQGGSGEELPVFKESGWDGIRFSTAP